MMPKLLGVCVLSCGEENRAEETAKKLRLENPEYDVLVECFEEEDRQDAHCACLQEVREEAFEMVVLFGSALPPSLLVMLREVAPDVEIVNWANTESLLDVHLRRVFRSQNRAMVGLINMVAQARA